MFTIKRWEHNASADTPVQKDREFCGFACNGGLAPDNIRCILSMGSTSGDLQ